MTDPDLRALVRELREALRHTCRHCRDQRASANHEQWRCTAHSPLLARADAALAEPAAETADERGPEGVDD